MPFTISHAAIVLPLKKVNKKYISMTGLIIGSMSPDLEYFSRMNILATYGHNWLGAVYFDLPIALIYCFIYHLFVRNILINHLPYWLKSRFVSFESFDWINYFKSNWLVVILSILGGTYTHLLWDLFTHEWGFFVQRITILNEIWINFGEGIRGYKFLQYFSSIIGLGYIFYWVKLLPQEDIKKTFEFSFWIKWISLTVGISIFRILIFPINIMTGNLIVVPIMAGFISLICFGIRSKLANKKA